MGSKAGLPLADWASDLPAALLFGLAVWGPASGATGVALEGLGL